MKTADWKKINRIVVDALELDEGEREDFVEKSCGDSTELKNEVKSLLAGEPKAEDFFDAPAAFQYAEFFAEDEKKDQLTGQKIGVYTIERELGYGGMGAVYLATRTDGKFKQRVALKLLKREMNTAALRRRFQTEREILASLEHPNIARLLNAGTTDDKIPYLAMEYVEGLPIDDYCNKYNLDLNQRLNLFCKVCSTVDFAHRNLIVHRDLKPSNILITADGTPKLLDFGISKILSEEFEQLNTATVTKMGVMTPSYASPEQIKGESVTTATDVYSLGVILFKLLTGAMPFDTKNKPESVVLSEVTDSQPRVPSETATENSKSLKGDLDNIILKSLRKEPERRYTSVERFAADIWRFIDGLPVTARPATFSYRASKFYGRNKIQVLAGVLILLSLITGIAVAVWQASIAREQARIAAESQANAEKSQLIAEKESAKSKAEEERAKKVTEFMIKIVNYANPHPYAEGFETVGQAKVIDALDDLSNKIETEFPNDIDIQADLHHKFGETYGQQGGFTKSAEKMNSFYVKAVYHHRKALELKRKFYGENHETIAKEMYYLRHTVGSLEDQAKFFAKAIQMMRETNRNNVNLPWMLASYAELLVADENLIHVDPKFDPKEVQETFYKYAIPKPTVGKLDYAEQYMLEAKPLFEAAYPQDHYANIHFKCRLAIVYVAGKKYKEAKENMKYCHIDEKKFGLADIAIEYKKYEARMEKALREEYR